MTGATMPWPAWGSPPGLACSYPHSHLARPSHAELLRKDAQRHGGAPSSGGGLFRAQCRPDGHHPSQGYSSEPLHKAGCGGQEPGTLLVAGPIHRGLRKKTKLFPLGWRSQAPKEAKFPVAGDAGYLEPA